MSPCKNRRLHNLISSYLLSLDWITKLAHFKLQVMYIKVLKNYKENIRLLCLFYLVFFLYVGFSRYHLSFYQLISVELVICGPTGVDFCPSLIFNIKCFYHYFISEYLAQNLNQFFSSQGIIGWKTLTLSFFLSVFQIIWQQRNYRRET